MALEKGKDYWANKVPCWEIRRCEGKPGGAPDCPAYKNQNYPCWEIKGTICKGASGMDTSICLMCKLYKEHGKGKAVEIKI